MTLDSIIAITALLIAVWAIIPRAQRLAVYIRFRWVDWILAIAAVLAVHYLVLYTTFDKLGLALAWPLDKIDFTPSKTAYLVVVMAAIIIGWRISRARFSRTKALRFQQLVEELLYGERHAEVFELIDRHIETLVKVRNADYRLPRLKRSLEKFGSTNEPQWQIMQEITQRLQGQEISKLAKPSGFRKFTARLRPAARALARLLPDYNRWSEAAEETLNRLMTSEKVVSHLCRQRPYLGIRLLEKARYETDAFLGLYLRALLRDQHSALYFELKNNQNVESNRRYELPESNRLLHYFFADSKVAENLGVWQPVGEEMISNLDYLSREPSNDSYNQPMDDYHERGVWRCPLFVGLSFFDIMVSSALHQGITWHMWLYYYTHFVERIVRNYRLHSACDPSAIEWPSRYSFLLYVIINTLADWMSAPLHLPEDQENIKITEGPSIHENGNIPKSAIFALTDCLRDILLSDQVPEPFKRYLMDTVWRKYFKLRAKPKGTAFAEVLRYRLANKEYHLDGDHAAFTSKLLECLDSHDKFHYEQELIQELEQALGRNGTPA